MSPPRPHTALTLAVLLAAVVGELLAAPSPTPGEGSGVHERLPLPARLRRPVALALSPDGRWLYVANHRSGSLSVIDTRRLQIHSELDLGGRLAEVVLLPRGDALLVLDEARDELLVLARDGPRLAVKERVPTSPHPVSLVLDRGGQRCFVAALWSRRVDVIALAPARRKSRRLSSIELPFQPRVQLLLPGRERLVVADSFGGQLAVISLARGRVEALESLRAHNIRGLAATADEAHILISHQAVNEHAATRRDDVLWGSLMSNVLTTVTTRSLVDRQPGVEIEEVVDLGEFANPAADPGALLVTETQVMVALEGVGKVALGATGWPRFDHVAVGRRPRALERDPRGLLYVANAFSDSVSVIEVETRRSRAEISLGPQPALTLADRGELLFYDANRSLLGWMSCHSCHTDGHANGQRSDTLGDGSYGAPKRVPSLMHVGETGPWAWDGSVSVLAAQIAKSMQTTLRATEPSARDVEALEAFLHTLTAPRNPNPADPEAVARGRRVFDAHRCQRCHTPPTFTSPRSRDVGLPDEEGRTRFNPPSLLGVSHRSSFFHDGRGRSLRQVFTVHQHPRGRLAEDEVEDLLAFLRSL